MTGLGASRRASRSGGVSQDSLVLVLSGYQVTLRSCKGRSGQKHRRQLRVSPPLSTPTSGEHKPSASRSSPLGTQGTCQRGWLLLRAARWAGASAPLPPRVWSCAPCLTLEPKGQKIQLGGGGGWFVKRRDFRMKLCTPSGDLTKSQQQSLLFPRPAVNVHVTPFLEASRTSVDTELFLAVPSTPAFSR